MTLADLMWPLIVAAVAVAYGVLAGRAQASRLRSLHTEVSNGKLRGYLVIAVVIGIVLSSFVFQK